LDQDVLDVIQQNIAQIERIRIVNGNRKPGEQAYDRIMGNRGWPRIATTTAVFDGGFTEFLEKEAGHWLK